MVLENFLNWIFRPITDYLSPFWGVVAIALIVDIITVLASKFFTNQVLMKTLKDDLTALQKNLKEEKDTNKKMTYQQELLGKQMQMMKHNFRPLLITLLPLLLIFNWLRSTYGDAGELIRWGAHIPLFGTGFGWFGTYFFSAIVFSIILRKLLKVH